MHKPCEDVLRVVVSQIHGWRSTDGNTFWFSLIVCEQVWRCAIVRYPNSFQFHLNK